MSTFKTKRKTASVIVVLVALGAFLGWEFGIKANIAKSQEFRGSISRVYKTRDWLRGFKDPLDHAQYRYYNHYWEIKCDDGQARDVEVNHYTWRRGEVGLPVVKVKGERWPKIDTPEEEERRRMSQEALGTLIDGALNRLGGD